MMSDQFAPRNDPEGRFTRTCPACNDPFRTDNARAVYCSYECRRRTQNQRHYKRHRKDIIMAVIKRREAQKED